MSDTESALLQALQDVLAEPFSAADLDRSLLALGADSLRAAALAARIHRSWGARVSVAQLLRLPRVSELLQVLPAVPRQLPVPRSAQAVLEGEHVQSPAQALVYMEHFRNPGTTAYNIPVIAELPQAVSAQKFSDALQQVAAGLPLIFARFYEREGRCLWCWRGTRDIPLRRFANLDEARREWVQPFNLAEDVLLRAGIVPFDGRRTYLMLDFSHIVADGVSVGQFVGRLKGALSGLPPASAPDATPCIWRADAAWQAQHQNDQAFWQGLLQEAGAKPVWAGLPDLPPRAEPGHGYAVQYTDIDEAQAEAFRACAQRSGSTPFTLALLLQYLLQAQWARVWRSHVGVVVSGRADADSFEAFGMFANTVIVPLELGAHMPLQEAIGRVHGRVLQVLEHQGFPAADQVRLSGARSDDGSHPLLDVLFAFQNIDYQRIDVLGGRFRSFCEAKKMAQFALVLHVFDIGRQGYQLQWEYCPHRYSHGDVAAFSAVFMRLFQRLLAAEPATALGVLMEAASGSGRAAVSVAATTAVEFDFGE